MPTPPLSPEIGQTENALRALLLSHLAGTGIESFSQYAALNMANDGAGKMARVELENRLIVTLALEAAVAANLLDVLFDRGMLAIGGGRVSLTEIGRERLQAVRRQVQDVNQRLYAGLATEDIDAARRVLTTVRERANAERALTR